LSHADTSVSYELPLRRSSTMKPVTLLTRIAPPPQVGPRARTYRLLLEHAMGIAQSGQVPSVAQIAMQAGVSRATAYRYFPTRSTLIAAMVHHSLGPVRSWRGASDDGRDRVAELFDQTFPRFKEYEPQLRAALMIALEHQLRERAGLLEEEPYRRGYRVGILQHAVEPLKRTLGPKGTERLIMALAMVYGIEPYVIWKDIFGANDRTVETVARWMAQALVDAALRDARGASSSAPSQTTRARGKSAKARGNGTRTAR
jgi:AcrR family transcriptional regulator